MDDSRVMRPAECRRDLRCVLERFVNRQRSTRHTRCQRLALEQFHHEITNRDQIGVAAPLVARKHGRFADVVKNADVRMVQRGDRARLTIEALAGLRVVRHMRRQHFDGHGAAEPRVARAVNLAHSPGTNPSAELVRTDPGAFQVCHDVEVSE